MEKLQQIGRSIILVVALTLTQHVWAQRDTIVLEQAELEQFRIYVNAILSNTCELKVYQEYPTMPTVNDEVLLGLYEELKQDSARYYFEQLSCSYWGKNQKYSKSIGYFRYNQLIYCLLATSVHWTTERLQAIDEVYVLMTMKLLINATKETYERMEEQEDVVKRFYINVLERIPWTIAGNESAAIHQVQLNNMAKCLNFICYNTIYQPHLAEKQVITTDKLEKWKSCDQ